MACCQRHNLFAPAEEEHIAGDEEGGDVLFDAGRQSGGELAFGAGLQDTELHSLRVRRFLQVSNDAERRSVRIHE